MKNRIHITKNALLILTLLLLAGFSAPAADLAEAGTANRFKNVIAQKLTEKLRVELADQTVEVKINDLQNRDNSQNTLDLAGTARAVVKDEKTELPLEFNAKVNLINHDIEVVSYKFVESASVFAAAAAEDNLTRELIAQISKDYQTTNIVISIDGFDTAKPAAHRTKYEGIGEVRIGDFEWSKIKFNVTIDSQNKAATKILYQVQK